MRPSALFQEEAGEELARGPLSEIGEAGGREGFGIAKFHAASVAGEHVEEFVLCGHFRTAEEVDDMVREAVVRAPVDVAQVGMVGNGGGSDASLRGVEDGGGVVHGLQHGRYARVAQI